MAIRRRTQGDFVRQGKRVCGSSTADGCTKTRFVPRAREDHEEEAADRDDFNKGVSDEDVPF